MAKKSIYLAHPISLNSADAVFTYYDNLTNMLKDKFTVFSPMYAKNILRTERQFRASGYDDNPITTNHAIFERDTWMVNQSDIVLCDLTDATNVSIGCCMELAIASWLHKHTIVVMEKENIHQHAFILESADIVFENIDDALIYLDDLCKGK